MRKTFLVLRNEFLGVVRRRSYILTLVLIPLVGFLIMAVVSALQNGSDGSGGSNVLTELVSPSTQVTLEGFVDASGLIKTVPPGLTKRLKTYASEKDAQQALHIGEISAYYLIAADYMQTGSVVYVRPDFNPLGGISQSGVINQLLEYNLLNGDQQLLDRLNGSMNLQELSLSQQPARQSTNALTFFLPYIVTMFFYIIILTSASLLLSSISTEKENRVIEIVMTSVTPLQMLTGKIIALGATGLIQTVVWSGAGLLLMRLNGTSLNIPLAFQLPVSILAWGVLFFLLGYALYGSLMAGLGALVPNLREASQATTVIIIPMIIPLLFINNLIDDPNGSLSVILSLFPLTSPVTMMTRLSATQVPVWQPVLAAFLLVGTVYLAIRGVAGMFRAQNLLSGQPFKLGRFFRELFRRSASA
jgi:ABC-2 type transport system permease protein